MTRRDIVVGASPARHKVNLPSPIVKIRFWPPGWSVPAGLRKWCPPPGLTVRIHFPPAESRLRTRFFQRQVPELLSGVSIITALTFERQIVANSKCAWRPPDLQASSSLVEAANGFPSTRETEVP